MPLLDIHCAARSISLHDPAIVPELKYLDDTAIHTARAATHGTRQVGRRAGNAATSLSTISLTRWRPLPRRLLPGGGRRERNCGAGWRTHTPAVGEGGCGEGSTSAVHQEKKAIFSI